MAARQKTSDKSPEQSRVAVWRNRIVGRAEVKAKDLVPHPSNWRMHPEPQRRAFDGLLREVGWVQDVIVNRRTGHVLDGHMRRDMAAAAGELVPVVYVDLSEDEERLVLASFDPVSALAVSDEVQLRDLVGDIETSSKELDLFFQQLVSDADLVAPTEQADPEPQNTPATAARRSAPKAVDGSQVKAIVYAKELDVFEQALRLTGEKNRGAALIAVCRSYIDSAIGSNRHLSVEGSAA